ncbi:MAG: hypothetical protein IPK64_13950 [bacterium]|nr:hypothetical protein [bacterium]
MRVRRGYGGMAAAATVVILVALAAGTAQAAVWEASAGWALTDVGLHEDRGGLVLGVGARTSLAPVGVDLVYALEYVQKRGAQPTWFSDPVTGFRLTDAEVTLHVAQPVVMLELAAMPWFLPRPRAGLSAGLKLSEEWSSFPGVPSEAWGYRDLDFALHLGLSWRSGPFGLEARYCRGLSGQLVPDPTGTRPAAAKYEDPLPGVDEPRDGTRLTHWQFTAAIAF